MARLPDHLFTRLLVHQKLNPSVSVSKRINIFAHPWDVSSVGLEHRLDRAGVVGSNPSHPTTESLKIKGNQ
jgi:hypothetical protein